jgi:molybdopterin converting factor small subunit
MNHVVVRLPAALRPFADGATELHVPAGTLADIIRALGGRHPALLSRLLTPEGSLRPYVNVFVGSMNSRDLQGLGTVVPDGTEVSILPAVAGG